MTDAEIIAHLKGFDTPTIANALNPLRGRTIQGYTRPPFVAARPKAPPMVGYALTAKLVSDTPSTKTPAEQKALRSAYYRYIGGAKRPGIVVIEDHGATPGIGAFWGEVNTAIHIGLGLSGIITNGAVRDLDVLSDDLPILAGCVCLNNGFTNLTAIDVPVTVFGMTIHPGDLLHADQHGAIRIPQDCLQRLPGSIQALAEREAQVIEATRQPGFDAEAMIRAWEVMEAHH